jgi:site-specific recombinase XerD
MSLLSKFTKLMKSEPANNKKQKHDSGWVIDERKCISMNEIKKLRRICSKAKTYGLKNKRFSQIRNWFMVELGLNSGLRVGEMASLRHGNLVIDNSKSSIVLFGKGNKKRVVWISSGFKRTCWTYLAYKKRFGYSVDDESYLLNNLQGNKITKRALQKSFKNLLEKAGLPGYYHVHCLRHTYTTFLLKASNYNYRFVQQQLGHASIRTTQVYAGVIESDAREAIERLYQ